jgi:bifunctional DNA-binding transcriptional regulator/antitoxin component of YhaV-PrlF toxin-antitoxin module
MIILKVAQIGEDMGLLLTDEARELLGVKAGDTLEFEATPDGGLRLAKLDMSFDARRERGRAFLKRYQKTFEALAK